ncbi:MAG: class I SAM-dependent methyltransferase [Mycobacterium pseudokansasii]|nr:class I SAM-dependent methyltransferase [Mycobacterium pseudokansasii]
MPRTDNDTWDLATSVGATATMVAAARAIATKAPAPLIEDRFAEPLVRAVGVDFFTRWATGDLVAADVDDDESVWKLEHMPDAMAARTRFFDSFFRDATQAGIRQAVILASGLDARAYRLAWPADMTVFEIDQPQVIGFKTATLARLGAAPAADLRPVAVDLRHDWPKALLHAGFDRSRPTAWIAEGLFGYLPPAAQDRLLDNVTALSADGSRLGCEAVPDMSRLDVDKAREMMRRATAKPECTDAIGALSVS